MDTEAERQAPITLIRLLVGMLARTQNITRDQVTEALCDGLLEGETDFLDLYPEMNADQVLALTEACVALLQSSAASS